LDVSEHQLLPERVRSAYLRNGEDERLNRFYLPFVYLLGLGEGKLSKERDI
jgi:hypothetical protein